MDYASNPDKCTAQEFTQYADSLTNAIDYAINPDKTDALLYVTGINCSAETAVADMERTKRRFAKTDGIIAFHAVQSFAIGEVTPDMAHEIGIELARRMWGARFEVVVTTHLDQKHLHNHFVINSVSFADGLRYYDNKRSYYGQLRRYSDELCREHSLSVISHRGEDQQRFGSYSDWQDAKNIRAHLKADLDRHMLMARDWEDFKRNLAAEGFAITDNPRRKYVTVLPPYGLRPLRLKASVLGADYTPEALKDRITYHVLTGQSLERPVSAARKQRYRVRGNLAHIKRPKLHGFAALYWRYMYLLGKAGKRRAYLSPQQRREITQQLRRFEQMKTREQFLRANGLSTAEQLHSFRADAQREMDLLVEQRQGLYNRRHGDPDVRHAQITQLTERIGKLRQDIKLCSAIDKESASIADRSKRWHDAMREQAVPPQQDAQKIERKKQKSL